MNGTYCQEIQRTPGHAATAASACSSACSPSGRSSLPAHPLDREALLQPPWRRLRGRPPHGHRGRPPRRPGQHRPGRTEEQLVRAMTAAGWYPGRPDHLRQQRADRRGLGAAAALRRRPGQQPVPVRPQAGPGLRAAGRRQPAPAAPRPLLALGQAPGRPPGLVRLGHVRRARRPEPHDRPGHAPHRPGRRRGARPLLQRTGAGGLGRAGLPSTASTSSSRGATAAATPGAPTGGWAWWCCARRRGRQRAGAAPGSSGPAPSTETRRGKGAGRGY